MTCISKKCLLLRYAGYCPQAKFWHYGDTFGNTSAKCFQERRTARLKSSVMKQPGTSGDGRPEFPTVYSNTPNLVLAARARTRERWRNAKKYSLFNEHERGREVKEFDQVLKTYGRSLHTAFPVWVRFRFIDQRTTKLDKIIYWGSISTSRHFP